MAKPPAFLHIDPSVELTFEGPFTDVVHSRITLTNECQERVCFKIKTTAPKMYCVRPNTGLLDVGSTASVTVMLQPFDHQTTARERMKHKFMVQSAKCDDVCPESNEPTEIWPQVPPNTIVDHKLRCAFLNAPPSPHREEVLSQQVPQQVSGVTSSPPGIGQTAFKTGDRSAPDEVAALQAEIDQYKRQNQALAETQKKLTRLNEPFDQSATGLGHPSRGDARAIQAGGLSAMAKLLIGLCFIMGLGGAVFFLK